MEACCECFCSGKYIMQPLHQVQAQRIPVVAEHDQYAWKCIQTSMLSLSSLRSFGRLQNIFGPGIGMVASNMLDITLHMAPGSSCYFALRHGPDALSGSPPTVIVPSLAVQVLPCHSGIVPETFAHSMTLLLQAIRAHRVELKSQGRHRCAAHCVAPQCMFKTHDTIPGFCPSG